MGGGEFSGMHYFLPPFICALRHCFASSHHFEAGKSFQLNETEPAQAGITWKS